MESLASPGDGGIVDLSHSLENGMQVYPGDPVFHSRSHASVKSDGYAVTHLSFGSHAGTHVDAPSHFFENGKTIDQLPLSTFIGPAVVVDLEGKGEREKITWDDLVPFADQLKPGRIVLLKTGWSRFWGTPKYHDHPFLEKGAAEKIVAKGVKALGVDTLNPDETVINGEGVEGFGVHEVLLGSECVIVENLTNLGAVESGMIVQFIPLRLAGSDGSPIRGRYMNERMQSNKNKK
ncbi:hypothetical protein ONZ45_g5820 [Pleurotus djamor]|nr:hypothetical protein ONZ45_g5820 [Pleurotus djamor]